MKRFRLALLLTLIAVTLASCNKLRDTAIKQKIANDLKKLCDLYGDYYAARGHAPAALEDLEPLATGDAEAESALRAARAGRYVLLWGVDIKEVARTAPGMAFTVLGYERDVPQSGGMVLMVDGIVLEMKPAKFATSQMGNALKENRPG
jgi:hypothetical protein